jgi:hypothetical protein
MWRQYGLTILTRCVAAGGEVDTIERKLRFADEYCAVGREVIASAS